MLNEVGRGDTAMVGRKAAALAELLKAGFNVPPGVVLTTAAYPEIVQPLQARIQARLTDKVIMDPAEIENAASEIRGWIHDAAWSPSMRSELEFALARLPSQGRRVSFVARTSLPSDDLATAFGSGVERAYLGLVGAAEVIPAAARSWGALWTSRAMYYRHRKRISQTGVALAVLVQPLVKADSAGVLFTRNPMTREPDTMQVDSIWGLGAPLTGARARPDRFLISSRDLAVLDRAIEDKTVKLVVGDSGHTEQRTVDAALVQAPSLEDTHIRQLAALGKRIEELFGAPQAIEWARVGDELLILQARPLAL